MNALERRESALAILDLISGETQANQCDELNSREKRALARNLKRVNRWDIAGEITGLGIGQKEVAGVPTNQRCIRIYLKRKRPMSGLSPGSRIPSEMELEGFEGKVLLDVVEQPEPRLTSLTSPQSVLFPGISVGHCTSGNTGTIGAFCYRKSEPEKHLLISASHVIAVSGLASKRDAIIQPGQGHGGSCPQFTIAGLWDRAPLSQNGLYPNRLDAALALLKPETPIKEMVSSPKGIAHRDGVKEDDLVARFGCISGRRVGEIKDLDFRCRIRHRFRKGSVIFGFRDLLLYSAPSLDGDSGGPLLNRRGELVGIHMARVGLNAVATPIWNILGHWPDLELLQE